MNKEKERKSELVKIATSVYEYTDKNGKKAKREFGFYRDGCQYILKRKGSVENWYYSSFLSVVRDLFAECIKLGINKVELSHIQDLVAKANKMIDRFYKPLSDENLRLELELEKTKSEIDNLKIRNIEMAEQNKLSISTRR